MLLCQPPAKGDQRGIPFFLQSSSEFHVDLLPLPLRLQTTRHPAIVFSSAGHIAGINLAGVRWMMPQALSSERLGKNSGGPFDSTLGISNRSKPMTDSNRIMYFLVGVAVGAAATILYTPMSGAKTRKTCQNKVQETADMFMRQAEDLRNRAVKTVERGNHELEQQFSKFSAAMDAGKRAFKKAS